MADITDPEVIEFSNQYARPVATKLRDFWRAAQEMKAEYLLDIADNAAWQAADGGDAVMDSNGETQPYTKQHMVDCMTLFGQLLSGNSGFESGGGLNGTDVMDPVLKLIVRAYAG